jgi:hypothetical protein
METVTTCQGGGEHEYLDRMGWYERPATQTVEFWWMGSKPIIVLDAMMLDIMPFEIAMEIKASVTVKPLLED